MDVQTSVEDYIFLYFGDAIGKINTHKLDDFARVTYEVDDVGKSTRIISCRACQFQLASSQSISSLGYHLKHAKAIKQCPMVTIHLLERVRQVADNIEESIPDMNALRLILEMSKKQKLSENTSTSPNSGKQTTSCRKSVGSGNSKELRRRYTANPLSPYALPALSPDALPAQVVMMESAPLMEQVESLGIMGLVSSLNLALGSVEGYYDAALADVLPEVNQQKSNVATLLKTLSDAGKVLPAKPIKASYVLHFVDKIQMSNKTIFLHLPRPPSIRGKIVEIDKMLSRIRANCFFAQSNFFPEPSSTEDPVFAEDPAEEPAPTEN